MEFSNIFKSKKKVANDNEWSYKPMLQHRASC